MCQHATTFTLTILNYWPAIYCSLFLCPDTSRQARSDETGGVDYHFVSVEVMQSGIQDHHFVEAGTYNSNLYGTSVEAVQLVATKVWGVQG